MMNMKKNYYKKDAEWNKKNIRKRFISFLIATSIMIGGGIGLQRLVKKESIKNKYNRTIEVYSTITDETTTETAGTEEVKADEAAAAEVTEEVKEAEEAEATE